MAQMFDPFKTQARIVNALADLDTAARDLYENRSHYTDTGLAAAWEQRTARYRAERDTLAEEIAAARAGAEQLQRHALEQVAPPLATADPMERVAAELMLPRMWQRVERAGDAGLTVAVEIAEQHAGTPFAGLWLEEVQQRGMSDVVDVLAASNADVARAREVATYAETILNNSMARGLQALDRALDVQRPQTYIPATAQGSPLADFEPWQVGKFVTDPFRWAVDGSAYEAAEVINARKAANAVMEQVSALPATTSGEV